MGHFSNFEALALRWGELCRDPMPQSVPGKIELNGYGVIELSPASNRHALVQGAVAAALSRHWPDGDVLVECSVATSDGVRVPDVAWCSEAFSVRHGAQTPFSAAPEICVEVRSPSNSEDEMALKTRLYLEAGAVEVWIVVETGATCVFDAGGERPTSRWPVVLALR